MLPTAFEDYAELMTQFGFITLFATAYPLCATLAFINNLIEIRIDAIKLVGAADDSLFSFMSHHLRPEPTVVKDIGLWKQFLEITGYFAVVTNCALVFFTAEFADDFTKEFRLVGFFGASTIFFISLYLIQVIIPDEPEDVKIQRLRREFRKANQDKSVGIEEFKEKNPAMEYLVDETLANEMH